MRISFLPHTGKPSIEVTLANLRHANLENADLGSANLRRANLENANLRSANLWNVNLSAAKNTKTVIPATCIVPQEGEVICWKRAGDAIVKLRVPPEAKRSNATGRKCRAEFVEVLAIEGAEEAFTCQHGPLTHYHVGETVRADGWDENRWNECSHGIHFFLTREEAEAWG